MRRILFKLHSYMALMVLIPIMIVSLTGSILVFKTEIDQQLMPRIAALNYADEKTLQIRKNHNILQDTIENQFPNFIIGSWEIFNDGKEADRVYLIKKDTDDWYKIYFDPYQGKVLSEPTKLGSYLTDWLLELHFTFLLKNVGTFIGLIAAFVLCFLGISGLIIHRKFWRQLLRLRIQKSWRIISGDAHRLVGAWSAPVVLILGITGIYFNAISFYHEVFEHREEEHCHPTTSLYGKGIDFQALLNNSESQLSGFTPTYLLYPYEPDVNITIYGYQPHLNPFASNYSSVVTYDRMTGQLSGISDGREVALGIQVVDSFRELHFGSFAGLTSKIIWSLFGLAPFILSITGLTIWLTRKRQWVYSIFK